MIDLMRIDINALVTLALDLEQYIEKYHPESDSEDENL